MNVEDFREHCLSVKGSSESFPFDDTILVFKIMNKMFAYIGLEPKDGEFFANMKCEPERSVELRKEYEGIRPGYHTTKRLWNSVYIDSDVPNELIVELIHHSVEEVIAKLSKKLQEEYKNS